MFTTSLAITSSRLLNHSGGRLLAANWFSSAASTTTEGFVTGTVKFYDKRKSWGIVVGQAPENQEYFIHRRSIVSWISAKEDVYHPYLKVFEQVRFKPHKSDGRDHTAMEALELTLIDGSQVPAYRSDYIPGNLKRLSHIMGERVYDIMSSPKLMDEQKWNEVVKVYDATKQALDVHVQLIQRQRKAIGIPSTIETIVTKKESDEGEPEREHGP
jgi:hypothetical protein